MLSSLHFTPHQSTDATWHEFIRRVTCYHVPKVTKFHEHKLLPSYCALSLHCKRASYVLKLTMSTPWILSPFLFCHEQFGWHEDHEGNVLVTWDDEDKQTSDVEDSSESDYNSDVSDSDS